MRDYADYFIDRKPPEKRGVSIHKDIDWWMETITGHMAKLLFIVLLATLALAIKSLMQVGKSDVFFPIERITLSGDVRLTTSQDINQALAEEKKSSFFAVNLNDISDKLSGLPWVKSATVVRRWPDQLQIQLVEHSPDYRWGDNELIDSQSNRFANRYQALFNDLPQIHGPDGLEDEVIIAYQRLLGNLGIHTEKLAIDKFILNPYLSWELHLQSGVVVKFGRDDYEQRLARFSEAVRAGKLPKIDQVDILDFRYHRGFAIKWKPEFTPQTQDGELVKVATDI